MKTPLLLLALANDPLAEMLSLLGWLAWLFFAVYVMAKLGGLREAAAETNRLLRKLAGEETKKK